MELGPNVPRNYYGSVELNNSNAVLGDQYVTILPQQEAEIDKKSRLFLASVKDPDMNARRNDIHETRFDTFEWMMQDDTRLGESIPSITRWLSHGTGKFFIQGKAGSGKSTLMKFIFEHERTKHSVRQWSPKCALLFHAFWTAGSQSQKTLRGLVSSLVFQIIHQDRQRVLELSYDSDSKSCLSDWSTKELSRILITLLQKQSYAYCIFIDGLDEHDDFDIDLLLVLIDNLIALPNVKICLSSRPILHIVQWATECPILVLHELTARDIEAYVTGILHSKLRSKSAEGEDFSDVHLLSEEICAKADGVFVWVYYVMHNVLKGLRISDDIDALRKRVADLPSEISVLYKQMWERQNSDNKVHADEARDMFSQVSEEGVRLFLFAMLFDAELRSRYISHPYPLDEAFLETYCRRIQKKIIVRCAGLLECLDGEYYEGGYYEGRYYKTRYAQRQERRTVKAQRVWWRTCKVKYFHRTAYDFVIGSDLAAPSADLLDHGAACVRYIEASIPCFVEEAFDFSHNAFEDHCFRRIGELGARDLPSAEVCIEMINRTVQSLLKDRLPYSNLRAWPKGRDFEEIFSPPDPISALLHFSFTPEHIDDELRWLNKPPHWLSSYLASHFSEWTCYYRGWATFCVITYLDTYWSRGVPEMETITAQIRVLNLILKQGANLCIPHCLEYGSKTLINSPASSLLSLLAGLVSNPALPLDIVELQVLCANLKSSVLPVQCGIWVTESQTLGLSSLFPDGWAFAESFRGPQHAVLLTLASDELLTAVLDSIGTGVDIQRDDDLPMLRSISFRSKLVSLSRTIRVVREDFCYHDLEDNLGKGGLQIFPIHTTVQEFLCSNDKDVEAYESDIRSAIDRTGDTRTGRWKPLVDPTIGLDLTVPFNTPLLPIDPFEEINMENWREKGALREYHAGLAASEDNLESAQQSQPSAAFNPPCLGDNPSMTQGELMESVSKKRKRSESMNTRDHVYEPDTGT